jgi:hypothetical protein
MEPAESHVLCVTSPAVTAHEAGCFLLLIPITGSLLNLLWICGVGELLLLGDSEIVYSHPSKHWSGIRYARPQASKVHSNY